MSAGPMPVAFSSSFEVSAATHSPSPARKQSRYRAAIASGFSGRRDRRNPPIAATTRAATAARRERGLIAVAPGRANEAEIPRVPVLLAGGVRIAGIARQAVASPHIHRTATFHVVHEPQDL